MTFPTSPEATPRGRQNVVLSLAIALGLSAAAIGQEPAEPFFEHTHALRHAYALESIDARLRAIGELGALRRGGELATQLAVGIEEELVPLFAGSLGSADEELLAALRASSRHLGQVLARDADAQADQLDALEELTREARDLLLPQELRGDLAFGAAVVSQLLLAEEGVAEGYEEAVAEEPEAFTLAWAALQGVHRRWAELSARVPSELAEEIEEALAELDGLLSGPLPRGELLGDPEDAEEPSHRIVALLERAASAGLYPDRDISRLMRLARELAERGCSGHAANLDLAREHLLAAELAYEQLTDLAGILAPQPHEKVKEAFEELEEDASAEGACEKLLEGLDEVRMIVGG